MSDLTAFMARETDWLHFKDTSGAPMYKDGDKSKPMRVELYGPGTRQNFQVKARQQARNFQRLRKKGSADANPEEQLADRAEDLAIVTKQFENIDLNGLSGAELFKAVFAEGRLGFMAEQAAEHQADWENFTPSSATS